MAIASTGLLKPHRYPPLPASSARSCFTVTSSSPQICCALRPTNGPLMAFGRRQCNQCNHGPGRRAPFPQKLPCHACHATGKNGTWLRVKRQVPRPLQVPFPSLPDVASQGVLRTCRFSLEDENEPFEMIFKC